MKTILLLCLLAALAPVSAGVLFETGFAEAPDRKLLVLESRSGKIADGMLELGKRDTGSSHCELNVAVDRPFKLTFRVRVPFAPPSNQSWGFFLHGREDVKFYFGGQTAGFNISKDRKTISNSHFPGKFHFPNGDDVRFETVEILVHPDYLALKINDMDMGTRQYESLPVNRISFYAYNNLIQIDDLKVELLPEKAENYVEAPVFQAGFENSLDAMTENGVVPAKAGSAVFADGVSGKAFSGNGEVAWELPDAFLGSAGGVMLWVSLNRTGEVKPGAEPFTFQGWSPFLLLQEDTGRQVLRMELTGHAAMASFPAIEKTISRFAANSWFPNDWNHLAVTWDKGGRVKFYVNGLPYFPANSWMKDVEFFPGLNLEGVRKIVIPAKNMAKIDGIAMFRRPLSAAEVCREYRKYAPLDVVLPRAVILPDVPESVLLAFAPGGEYIRPVPGNAGVFPAGVEVKAEILDAAGKVVKSAESVLKVDKPVEYKIPVHLPAGKYLVRCAMTRPDGTRSIRSFQLWSLAVPPAAAPSPEEVKPGKIFFEKVFTDPADPALFKQGKLRSVAGEYLEPGDGKGDRFGVEVNFPEEVQQKPCLIEITWPDDKPRMMGLYLYLLKPTGESFRDRLQAGIHAGREFPNSGKMVTSRYLFWPQTSSALFEIRTMANDFPAAIRSLKVSRLEEDTLPRLKINYPEGMEHRRLGHTDEDQSFWINLAEGEFDRVTERLLEYLDYTGQDIFCYPMLRYGFSFFPLPGSDGNGILYPRTKGSFSHLVEALHRRGKKFVGIVNFNSVPIVKHRFAAELGERAKDWVSLDKNRYDIDSGNDAGSAANPAHPEVRKDYIRHIEDFASREGKQPGFDGFELWGTLAWQSLDHGYDDYTVREFSRETGIEVPLRQRFEFLNSDTVRPEWIKWRAGVMAKFIREIREMLDRHNPDLQLYVPRRNESGIEDELAKELAKLPGVHFTHFRRPTTYLHGFHWGKEESALNEEMYDLAAVRESAARMSNELVTAFYLYYETFTKSMSDKYGCYFQSIDCKPHGRFFLKEFAFQMAAIDPLKIGFGGQPLGSLGRETETREFARAFSALPAKSFATVPNPNDSVTVRYLNTPNGTYFYAVSLVWTGSAVTLEFDRPVEYVDLSTGEKSNAGKIALNPFQLRSFLIPGKEAKITGLAWEAPAELDAFYRDRAAKISAGIQAIEKSGVDASAEKAYLAKMEAARRSANYAEAHRLAFSRVINRMLNKLGSIELVAKQSAMIRKNTFAVNCGGKDFYVAESGKLFFPDQKFEEGDSYGYYGKYMNVVRKIDDLKKTDAPLLFQTEAYDIDGYKFRLADGKYTIKLYMKIGYPDDFKEGKVVLTAYAQGKPLFVEKDLFLAGNRDFTQPLILTFPGVEVTGGLLTLKFETKKGLPSNVRLCNAIEIIPEAK